LYYGTYWDVADMPRIWEEKKATNSKWKNVFPSISNAFDSQYGASNDFTGGLSDDTMESQPYINTKHVAHTSHSAADKSL
jgi:hypothetical protein